jgi:hypothetical protein
MAVFNQNNQKVNIQYAGEQININYSGDIKQQLKTIESQLHKAIQNNSLQQPNATNANQAVDNAIKEADKHAPDANTLVTHLKTAKEAASGVESLTNSFINMIDCIKPLIG